MSTLYMLYNSSQHILLHCFQGLDPVKPRRSYIYYPSDTFWFPLCCFLRALAENSFCKFSRPTDCVRPPVLDALSTTTSLAKDPDLRFEFFIRVLAACKVFTEVLFKVDYSLFVDITMTHFVIMRRYLVTLKGLTDMFSVEYKSCYFLVLKYLTLLHRKRKN